jgi:hypothetical protein
MASYAVDPLDEKLVKQAGLMVWCAVCCLNRRPRYPQQRLAEYVESGVQVRVVDSLPMKLAVPTGRRIAGSGPVITRPAWTAVVFRHEGMGEAMKALFEERWRRGTDL